MFAVHNGYIPCEKLVLTSRDQFFFIPIPLACLFLLYVLVSFSFEEDPSSYFPCSICWFHLIVCLLSGKMENGMSTLIKFYKSDWDSVRKAFSLLLKRMLTILSI